MPLGKIFDEKLEANENKHAAEAETADASAAEAKPARMCVTIQNRHNPRPSQLRRLAERQPRAA
jgi:hypothetical protein